MKSLNNNEMIEIRGGGISSKLIFGILGGAIVFLIGVVDGIINPRACN